MAAPTPPILELMRAAEKLADDMGHPLVGSEHLLLAIAEADETVAAHQILASTGSLPAVKRYFADGFGRTGDGQDRE